MQFYTQLQQPGVRMDGKYKATAAFVKKFPKGKRKALVAAAGVAERTAARIWAGESASLHTAKKLAEAANVPFSKAFVNTSKGESDPKRRLLQFDVQQFCDNFVKGVDKALKDVSKSQKKSTPTRAPVAEPSIFISEKPKGKSENNLEDLKDFSDSLPIFDKYDEELMES